MICYVLFGFRMLPLCQPISGDCQVAGLREAGGAIGAFLVLLETYSLEYFFFSYSSMVSETNLHLAVV